MRTKLLSAVDLFVVFLSMVAALFVRDEFVFDPDVLAAAFPYFVVSMLLSVIMLGVTQLNDRLWRFVSLADIGEIVAASVIVGFGSYSACFLYNGAYALPRSLPLLHSCFILLMMTAIRVAARLQHKFRDRPAPLSEEALAIPARETVLLIGHGRIAELYARSLAEIHADAPGEVRIAGILALNGYHVGRKMLGYPILGTADQLEKVLEDLSVHGVQVDRLVIASATDKLPPAARQALSRVEAARKMRVTRLDAIVAGVDAPRSEPSSGIAASPPSAPEPLAPPALDTASQPSDAVFAIPAKDVVAIGQKGYWRLKRLIDIAAAAVLLIVTLPTAVVVGVLVLIDIGTPVIFWQQRPGLGGRPFKLYKFRTMRGSRDGSGNILSQEERCSGIGKFLRRSRLDELPQLLNILLGHMSFIGPRPLLQAEQSANYAARLLVRPGLTGFAQVMGGRDITIADKTALDVWYFHNASLSLDLSVALKTIPMVFRGERVSPDQISAVWRDLEIAGVSRAPQSRSASVPIRNADASLGLK